MAKVPFDYDGKASLLWQDDDGDHLTVQTELVRMCSCWHFFGTDIEVCDLKTFLDIVEGKRCIAIQDDKPL